MNERQADTHLWRLFAPAPVGVGENISLAEDEHHYAFHVLRLAQGAAVEVGDGRGWLARGVLDRCDKKGAHVRVEHELEEKIFGTRVHLFLGQPKPATLEDVVAQAAELGVAKIHVFRCVKSQSKAPLKREKLERLALESLRITKGFRAPEIVVHDSVEALLSTGGLSQAGRVFLCDESPLHEVGAAHHNGLHVQLMANGKGGTEDVGVIVGPESSFTDGERAAFATAGAVPVSLGPLVLRVPTAVAAAVSVAMGVFNPNWVRG